jgi:hypothetical protein
MNSSQLTIVGAVIKQVAEALDHPAAGYNALAVFELPPFL